MNNELDLPGEFMAARKALTLDHRKRLKAAGVPSFFVDVSGVVGVARIVAAENKFYFAPDGVEAFEVAGDEGCSRSGERFQDCPSWWGDQSD
jgi:hypothetical protein